MQADSFSTPSPEELQELYDVSKAITEGDLREYLEAEQRYQMARADLESARANLTEMLILGLGVDSSSELTVQLDATGRIRVEEKPGDELREIQLRKVKARLL